MTREERIVEVLSACFQRMQPENPEPPSQEEANYTALALVANRQVPYQWAWELPDTMMWRAGFNDPLEMFLALSETELETVIREPKCAHRLPATMARLMKGTALAIDIQYGGDFRNLYVGRGIPEILCSLLALPGYGRKLARLALRTIVVDWTAYDLGQVHGNRSEVDAVPDVHVCRVLHRLGLIDSPDPVLAIEVARALAPDSPYVIDGAFEHGLTVCSSTPRCKDCRLQRICPSARSRT